MFFFPCFQCKFHFLLLSVRPGSCAGRTFPSFFCVKPDIYKNTPLYLAAASPVMQKDNGLHMTAVPVLPGISFPLLFVSKSIFIIPSFFDFGLQAESCGPLHGHKKIRTDYQNIQIWNPCGFILSIQTTQIQASAYLHLL